MLTGMLTELESFDEKAEGWRSGNVPAEIAVLGVHIKLNELIIKRHIT